MRHSDSLIVEEDSENIYINCEKWVINVNGHAIYAGTVSKLSVMLCGLT